jgi:hypothetical protein
MPFECLQASFVSPAYPREGCDIGRVAFMASRADFWRLGRLADRDMQNACAVLVLDILALVSMKGYFSSTKFSFDHKNMY